MNKSQLSPLKQSNSVRRCSIRSWLCRIWPKFTGSWKKVINRERSLLACFFRSKDSIITKWLSKIWILALFPNKLCRLISRVSKLSAQIYFKSNSINTKSNGVSIWDSNHYLLSLWSNWLKELLNYRVFMMCRNGMNGKSSYKMRVATFCQGWVFWIVERWLKKLTSMSLWNMLMRWILSSIKNWRRQLSLLERTLRQIYWVENTTWNNSSSKTTCPFTSHSSKSLTRWSLQSAKTGWEK